MDGRQDVYLAATVLAVDDTPDNLMVLADLLKDRYRVKAASQSARSGY